MDLLPPEAGVKPVIVTNADLYKTVNGTWPVPKNQLPALTGPEAVSAFKRLHRFFLKRPWRGEVKVTSGNRRTWTKRGVMVVNPDQGWHGFIHDLSHWMHRKLHPKARPHDPRHGYIERDMIGEVVKRGWLDGKLRRATAEKPKEDVRLTRYRRVMERIATWQAKVQRAQRALVKLQRQQARYERVLGL